MTKEEKLLKEQIGCKNHFTVPENYFDSIKDNVMSALPEREPVRLNLVPHTPWYRRLSVAAAVILLVCICGGAWEFLANDYDNVSSEQLASEETIMSDYVVASNETIYAWMSN